MQEKNQNKTSMAKAAFRDSQTLSCLSGSRTDVPAEPPLIGPAHHHHLTEN